MKTLPRATASSSCHSLWWQENTKFPEPRETQDCNTHPHNQPPSAQLSSPATGSVFLQKVFLYHPGKVCFQKIIRFLTSFILQTVYLLFFVLHQYLFGVRNHSSLVFGSGTRIYDSRGSHTKSHHSFEDFVLAIVCDQTLFFPPLLHCKSFHSPRCRNTFFFCHALPSDTTECVTCPQLLQSEPAIRGFYRTPDRERCLLWLDNLIRQDFSVDYEATFPWTVCAA